MSIIGHDIDEDGITEDTGMPPPDNSLNGLLEDGEVTDGEIERHNAARAAHEAIIEDIVRCFLEAPSVCSKHMRKDWTLDCEVCRASLKWVHNRLKDRRLIVTPELLRAAAEMRDAVWTVHDGIPVTEESQRVHQWAYEVVETFCAGLGLNPDQRAGAHARERDQFFEELAMLRERE